MANWRWSNALIEGFSNHPQKGYIDVEPDAGIPFRRVKFTDFYDLVTCNFVLSRQDYIEVQDWYRNEIRQGSIPFTIYDCRYGIERTAHLIGDVPQFSPIQKSKYYNLTLNMAFEPAEAITEFIFTVNYNAQENILLVEGDYAVIIGQTYSV